LKGLRIEDNGGADMVVQYARRLMVQRASQEAPPSPEWKQAEWDMVRSSPPLIVLPYTSTSTGGDKITRAMRVVPFVEGRNVRLVDTAISAAWMQTLQSFPLATNDDAVDATVAGLMPFAGTGERQVVIDQEWIDKVVRKEQPKLTKVDMEGVDLSALGLDGIDLLGNLGKDATEQDGAPQ
jgi:predicted phage terminase large subunit-like protein